MVDCDTEHAEKETMAMIKNVFTKYQLKSKSITREKGIELVVEVRMKDGETDFVNKLNNVLGVSNTVLVSYNGDYVA